MTNYALELEAIVRKVTCAHRGTPGKRQSDKVVVPAIAAALRDGGFVAVQEYMLPGPIALGRIPTDGTPSKTLDRSWADIAVYREGALLGVIESEHDLDLVRRYGDRMPKAGAATTYTMSSIALDAGGAPFDSYGPLERMAYIANWKGDSASTAEHLRTIRSDAPADHNPEGLALFLVTEIPDKKVRILAPRLASMGVVHIVCSG